MILNEVFMGTSSSWSFGRRVLAMTHERVLGRPLPPDNLQFYEKVYDMGWDGGRIGINTHIFSRAGLPSADFALHLISTFKFNCDHLFDLLDEKTFMAQFEEFYNSDPREPPRSIIWYTHYLLILAFGKAFLIQTCKDRRPPGAEFFLQAMKLIPELTFYTSDNNIELTQVICCAALYLQCIGCRTAAYRWVSSLRQIPIVSNNTLLIVSCV